MQGRLIAWGAPLAAAAVLVAGPVAAFAGAAGKAKTVHLNCTFHTQQTSGSTALKGSNFGPVACSRPLGHGIAFSTYSGSLQGSTVTDTATFKNYFDQGTFHGTLKAHGTLVPNGTTTLKGTVKVTGGTGAYAHARGLGTVTCTTTDLGQHLSCKTAGTGTF